MPSVAGIDAGLTFVRPTSGVCRAADSGYHVAHTFVDTLSRQEHLPPTSTFDVLAIDAPVLPAGMLDYGVRPCEKAFVWRTFRRRCKPGESHVPGTGQALRRAGCETAAQFGQQVSTQNIAVAFPRIQAPYNILEAFPNGFLGVCLPDATYNQMPVLRRNAKSDWLMDQRVAGGISAAFQQFISWLGDGFWLALNENAQHDERAALVCVLTAACVFDGRYVAVGDDIGGYFFLPPWEIWSDWAKDALRLNCQDRRLPRPVEVWINGTCFNVGHQLPE